MLKDRGEEHDHDDGAGEEVAEGMAAGAGVAGTRTIREARAEGHPEEQRRGDDPDHAGLLAIEADDLALPQANRRRSRCPAIRRERCARRGCRRWWPFSRCPPFPCCLGASVQKRCPVRWMKTSSRRGRERRWRRLRRERPRPPRSGSDDRLALQADGVAQHGWRDSKAGGHACGQRLRGFSLAVSKSTTSPPIADFSSAGEPSATRLPSFRMASRSQCSASSIRWVVTSTVTPSSSRRMRRYCHRSRRAPGSRPVEGSSSSSTAGEWMRPLASSTRRCMPPERVST